MIRQVGLAVAFALTVAGCATTPATTSVSDARPAGAREGTCWAKQIKPAVIQTSRIQKLVSSINGSDVYETETSQTILSERQESWFEVPCRHLQTPEFIASLQRALTARGFYRGPITGIMDERTGKAVRLYQFAMGVDSHVLSLAAARNLGLVAIGLT